MGKICFAALALAASLFLFAACGESGRDDAARPVDAWAPFVQFEPALGVLEVRDGTQPTPHFQAYPVELAMREYEAIWGYFFPGPYLGSDFLEMLPDYFGGLAMLSGSVRVFIVEGMGDDAAGFMRFIQDFETAEVVPTAHSFARKMAVADEIMSSDATPVLWNTALSPHDGELDVGLFLYSDDEVEWFRRNVHDSPLVRFVDVFGPSATGLDMFHLMPPVFLDNWPGVGIAGISMTAVRTGGHDFSLRLHRGMSELDFLVLDHAVLEVGVGGGMFVPVMYYLPETDARRLPFEQGLASIALSTEHFARQLDGPFRANLYVRQPGVALVHRFFYAFD